eukprot:gene25522-30812_t
MEPLTSLDESVADGLLNESADQTTLECISFEQSDQQTSQGHHRSKLSVIKTSRRRVQKNTAVVLNADKMKRFALDESSMTLLEESLLEPPQLPANSNIELIKAIPIAAQRIINWWRRLQKSAKAAHTSRASLPQHDQLFALLLGYRVRKLLRTHEIKTLVSAHNDVRQVLYDLLPPPRSQPAPVSPSFRIESWRTSGKMFGLSDVDHALALSLYRTLLTAKEKFYASFFKNTVFMPQKHTSSGGYYKLDVVRGVVPKRQLLSPERSARPSMHVQETPPHVKQAVNDHAHVQHAKIPVKLFVNRHNSRLIDTESLSQWEEGDQTQQSTQKTMPKSLKDVLDAKLPAKSGIHASNGHSHPGKAASEDDRPLSASPPSDVTHTHAARRSTATHTAHTSAQAGAPPPPLPSSSRAEEGGHIVLHVLSGDRLMPARKGAVAKDAAVEADRIPCLKVSLHMPHSGKPEASSSRSAAGQMKKISQEFRDFDTLTLSPVWHAPFTLSLPLSKTPLKHLQVPHLDHDEDLSDSVYQEICSTWLDHWSLGQVEVEVLDRERFNEDIFMGYVRILLSSFSLAKLKANFNFNLPLEVQGNFNLEKRERSDRVAGTIHMHAYMYMPAKAHVLGWVRDVYGYGAKRVGRVSYGGKSKDAHNATPPPVQTQARSGQSTSEEASPVSSPPDTQDNNQNSSNRKNDSDAHPSHSNTASPSPFVSRFMREYTTPQEERDGKASSTATPIAPLSLPTLEESHNITLPLPDVPAHGQGVDQSKMRMLKSRGRGATRGSSSSSRSSAVAGVGAALNSGRATETDAVAKSTARVSRAGPNSSNSKANSASSSSSASHSKEQFSSFLDNMKKHMDDLSALPLSADQAIHRVHAMLASKKEGVLDTSAADAAIASGGLQAVSEEDGEERDNVDEDDASYHTCSDGQHVNQSHSDPSDVFGDELNLGDGEQYGYGDSDYKDDRGDDDDTVGGNIMDTIGEQEFNELYDRSFHSDGSAASNEDDDEASRDYEKYNHGGNVGNGDGDAYSSSDKEEEEEEEEVRIVPSSASAAPPRPPPPPPRTISQSSPVRLPPPFVPPRPPTPPPPRSPERNRSRDPSPPAHPSPRWKKRLPVATVELSEFDL